MCKFFKIFIERKIHSKKKRIKNVRNAKKNVRIIFNCNFDFPGPQNEICDSNLCRSHRAAMNWIAINARPSRFIRNLLQGLKKYTVII